MSDGKISLDFLGEQMVRMQTELRGVRSEQVRLDSDLRGLDGKVDRLDDKVEAVDAKVDRLDAKVDRLDGKVDRLDAKVDAHDASNKARFDQIQETAAINLAVTLEAFKGLERKIDVLK
jgi:outer membrane murein-binding lipoprotein Lpp